MICNHCGCEISSTDVVCIHCGKPKSKPGVYYAAPAYINTERNGLAVAGFVLALIGIPFCTYIVPGILGLVFSIIALLKSQKLTSGKGKSMAIAGIIIASIAIIITVLVYYYVISYLVSDLGFNGNGIDGYM